MKASLFLFGEEKEIIFDEEKGNEDLKEKIAEKISVVDFLIEEDGYSFCGKVEVYNKYDDHYIGYAYREEARIVVDLIEC